MRVKRLYISGTIKEMSAVLHAARQLNAKSAYFISPGTVLIIGANEEDYAFIKSSLIIHRSVMIPASGLRNMKIYLNNGVKQSKGHPYLDTFDTITFTPHAISFNDPTFGDWEVDNDFYKLRKRVEVKVKESIASAHNLDSPYLRLEAASFRKLEMELKHYKNRYLKKQLASDNIVRTEKDQLVLYHRHDEHEVRLETGIKNFAENENHLGFPYSFSDLSIQLIRTLSKVTPVENILFLPRKGFCVVEGYLSDMVIKVRTSLKNDFYQEKV